MFQSTRSDQASRRLRLSFFSSFSILIAAGAPAAAQVDSTLEVEEVVVSDIRSERSGISTPASIVVIGREEIEKSGASHVTEVLRGRGGVYVLDTIGDGGGASVSVRGFGQTSNANTLVLVDGRKLNNNDIGDPDLNTIPINDIERIEIVQGSAGTLFGDQAVGGVINIITRRPEKLRADLNLTTGSYNRRGAHGSVSQRLENGLYYRISGEHRASDNYRDHNEHKQRTLFAVTGYEYATGDVFAEFLHSDEQLNTPGALFADEVAADRRQVIPVLADDFADTKTTVERIGIRQTITDWLSFEAEGTNREAETDFFLSFRSGFQGPGEQSRHLTSVNPRFVAVYPTANGEILITLGHDLEFFDYKIDSVIGVQENEQKIRGNYIQMVVPVHPQWSVTLGARDAKVENDIRDDFTFPTGGEVDDSEFVTELGATFRPAENLRFFARRDESVRFAKVDELTNPTPGTFLRTQTGVSYELGMEWYRGGHEARLVAYRLDLDNEIAVAPTIVGAFPFNTNLPPTRRDGFILSGAFQATDRLRLSGDYSYIHARITEGPLEGNRVPQVPKHNLRVATEYELTPRWRVYGEVRAVSDQVFGGDFDRQLDTLPGYTVVDLKTDYRSGDWTFEARVNNVLNKKYSEFGTRASAFPLPDVASFFPSPERNFWFSARLEFD